MASTPSHPVLSGDGFTPDMSGVDARRQLRMSIGVVTMLAIGIVSAAATIGPRPFPARRHVASTAAVTVLHVDTAVEGASAI